MDSAYCLCLSKHFILMHGKWIASTHQNRYLVNFYESIIIAFGLQLQNSFFIYEDRNGFFLEKILCTPTFI